MIRISLFGLNIDIQKTAGSDQCLSLGDTRAVNDEAIRYLRGLSESEIQSRISAVMLPNLSDTRAVTETLESHGIVVVADFLAKEAVQVAEAATAELTGIIKDFREAGEYCAETEHYLIQKGTQKLSGYKALSSYGKAVIQIREGQDEGMVDVFNVDYLFREFNDLIRPAYESSPIKNILKPDAPDFGPKNLNLYINAGIEMTRGFHVDAYRKKLKTFIYLTDVLGLDDGPYTYVKGSHRDSSFRRMNKAISRALPNRTETPVVPFDNIIPVLARKGALVISDQGGSHRGFPQGPDNTRMLSVMNYS